VVRLYIWLFAVFIRLQAVDHEGLSYINSDLTVLVMIMTKKYFITATFRKLCFEPLDYLLFALDVTIKYGWCVQRYVLCLFFLYSALVCVCSEFYYISP